MLGNLFPLPDPTSERAFQLHYGKAGMMLDLLAACMRLLAFLAMLIKACWRLMTTASWAAAAAVLIRDSSWWMNLAMQGSILLVYAALGQEKYILFRGPFSIMHRVLYALGVATTARPGDCNVRRNCHHYWHHRLLITNTVSVLCRTPATAYWVGSVCCWTAQLLVFFADPQHSCGADMGCLAQAMLGVVSHPAELLQKLQQPSTLGNGVVFMLELVVPGLLLTYLEYRARRRFWLARQQHQYTADDVGQAGVRVVSTTSVRQHEKQQQDQRQKQRGERDTCWKHLDSRKSDQTSKPKSDNRSIKQLANELDTKQAADTAAVAAADQASSSKGAGAALRGPASTPGRTSIDAVAPHTPAIQDNQSLAAIKELAAAVAASMHHQPPRSRAPEGSFTNTNTAAAAPVGYNDLMPARMIIGGHDNLGTVIGPALGPMGRSLLYGSSRRRNGAAAVADGVDMGVSMPSALYVSPVRHQIMSFKFGDPLESSPELFEHFKAELTTLVHQYHAACGDPRPLVTQFSASQGCYQIVLSAAFMPSAAAADYIRQQGFGVAGAPAGSDDSCFELASVVGSQQQQQLQQQVESLLQGWPGWSLLALQLGEAAAAAEEAAVIADPLIMALPSVDAKLMPSDASVCSGSGSGRSIAPAADDGGKLSTTVVMNRGVLQQLQCEGYECIRVVAVQQATAEILLDQSWQLQQLLMCHDTGTGHNNEVHVAVAIEQSNITRAGTDRYQHQQQHQQQQVLSFVILAEKPASSTSMYNSKPEDLTTAPQQQQQQRRRRHSVSLTLAQLPLLVLPAAAAAELHRMLDEAVESGLASNQARLDMRDLVRDLAAVMYAGNAPLAAGAAAQQVQYQAIVAALVRLFSSRAMTACLELLQQCVPQSALLRAGAESSLGPAAAAPGASGLSDQAVHGDHGLLDGASLGAGKDTVPTDPCCTTPARMSASSSSSQISNESSSSSATSSSADEIETDSVAGRDPSWVQRAANCVKQQLPTISSEDGAGPAADAALLLDHKDMSVDDLHVSMRTSMLGFNHQLPGLESLYMSFKSTTLRSWDRFVTLWYLAVLCVLIIHTLTHYMRGASHEQLLVDAFRTESVLVDLLAHGVVLSASYKHMPPSLHRYRSVVLVALLAGQVAVVQGCLSHNSYRDAMLQVVRRRRSSPAVWLSYHHILKPFTLRVGEVATIGYLLVLLWYHWSVDPVVGIAGWPRLWSWIMCAVNVSVAWFLEVQLRRRFLDEIRAQQQQPVM